MKLRNMASCIMFIFDKFKRRINQSQLLAINTSPTWLRVAFLKIMFMFSVGSEKSQKLTILYVDVRKWCPFSYQRVLHHKCDVFMTFRYKASLNILMYEDSQCVNSRRNGLNRNTLSHGMFIETLFFPFVSVCLLWYDILLLAISLAWSCDAIH